MKGKKNNSKRRPPDSGLNLDRSPISNQVPAPNPVLVSRKKEKRDLEKVYYVVAIITMILSALFAGAALLIGNGAKEIGVSQGSNSNNFTIIGKDIKLTATEQKEEDVYEAPQMFQNDNLRLAYAADLMEQEKYQAAIGFLREYLQLPELSDEVKDCVNFNLGLCLLTTGVDYNQAASLLSEMADHVKQAKVYNYLCHACIRAKRPADALDAIERAIDLDDQENYRELRDMLKCETGVSVLE